MYVCMVSLRIVMDSCPYFSKIGFNNFTGLSASNCSALLALCLLSIDASISWQYSTNTDNATQNLWNTCQQNCFTTTTTTVSTTTTCTSLNNATCVGCPGGYYKDTPTSPCNLCNTTCDRGFYLTG